MSRSKDAHSERAEKVVNLIKHLMTLENRACSSAKNTRHKMRQQCFYLTVYKHEHDLQTNSLREILDHIKSNKSFAKKLASNDYNAYESE